MTIAVAVAVAPSALAAQTAAVIDCIVIDHQVSGKTWVYLPEPDFEGRRFRFEEDGEQVQYRHFEFLRADGLVIGVSARIERWTECYDRTEDEFIHMYKPPAYKRFDHAEFLQYVEDVRYSLNGYIVPPEQLG